MDDTNSKYGKKERFDTAGTTAEAEECSKAASKIVVQLPEYPTFKGAQFRGKVLEPMPPTL